MTTSIPVGVQLYAVRDDCAKDLPGTFAALAGMGYQGVEFAGYHGYDAKKLRALLDSHNLKCCGTHTGIQTLIGDALPATIEFNRALGNKFLIVPGLAAEYTKSISAWRSTATLFNDIAAKAKSSGMAIGYHAHNRDFRPLEGQVPWDIFFSVAQPDIVMQLDTGNAMDGGGDPVATLKKFPGRARTIHLKEFSATNPDAILGEGDVPWREVLTLCQTTSKTEWFIIEQETGVHPPLETSKRCLQTLRGMLAGKASGKQ